MNYNLPFALTEVEVDFTLPLELFEGFDTGFSSNDFFTI